VQIAKDDLPVRLSAPGAVARLQTGFGEASAYGTMSANVEEDGELLIFSPAREHLHVLDHVKHGMGQ
jgi:hypothetical protein